MKRITITSILSVLMALGPLWSQTADKNQAKDETATEDTGAEKLPPSDQIGRPDGASGQVQILGGNKQFERTSAKAEEYRDLPNGVSGSVDAGYKKGSLGISVKADKIGRKDQSAKVTGEDFGVFRVTAAYDSTPHNYGYGVHTPYGGVGTGYLSIAPAAKLADITPPGAGGSTTCSSSSGANSNGCEPIATAVGRMQGIADKLDAIIAMGKGVDIGLLREKGTLKLDVMALEPIRMNVTWSHENRTGTQPGAGGFAQSNAMELPIPIKYTTDDARLTTEYSSKYVYAMVAYSASKFDNQINALVWDNPFSASNGISGAPALTVPTTGAAPNTKGRYTSPGPIAGRMALYPDNFYQNITGSIMVKDLPLETKVDATAAFGFARQDDQLQPFTTNNIFQQGTIQGSGTTAWILPWDYSSPYSLPRASAKAATDTVMYNVLVTSRPLSFLRTRARYKVYEYENKTAQFITPGYVTMDSSFSRNIYTNERPGYEKRTGTLDADFQVLEKTNLTLTYNNEWMQREERESHNQHEDTYKGNLDQRFGESGSLVGFGMSESKRTGDYNPFEPFKLIMWSNPSYYTQASATYPGVNPQMRKFDEANRNRTQGDVHANVQILDSLGIGGKVIGRKDYYPDSDYGLRSSKSRTASGDIEWNPADRFGMGASYTQDRYDTLQRNRSWSGTVDNPYLSPVAGFGYSGSDWSAERVDRTRTYGFDMRFDVVPKTVVFHVSLADTITAGKIKYLTPVSDSTTLQQNLLLAGQTGFSSISTDTNNFIAQNANTVYDNRYQKFEGKVEWFLDELTTLTAGDKYERFGISDFGNFGFDYIPRNTVAYGTTTYSGLYNGMIMMDVFPKAYKTNFVYASYTRKF